MGRASLIERAGGPADWARRLAAAAAALAACAFAASLAVRTVISPDLGYHLAYGELFLDTGRVVDSDMFVYRTIASPAATRQLGPGCWYDGQGRYRFPNANWASQVVMAAVNRAGGGAGLSLLRAVLVAGVLALFVAAMRRLGVGWLGTAAGVVLAAMVAYERFDLRPELFGYLVLMGQLYVLVRGPMGGAPATTAPRSKLTVASCAWLVGLQVLLVNVHSYFLLGLGLTGAALIDRLLRWWWARREGRAADAAAFGAGVRRLGLLLAAQAAACSVNPWTWRLAALPLQTLLFIRAHAIAGGTVQGWGHPWSIIAEFFRPFAIGVFRESKATYAFMVMLGVLGAGIVAAAWRRRWGHVLAAAGMVAAGLTMRRNTAVCTLVAAPLAMAALRDVLAAPAARLLGRLRPAAATAASLLVTAAAGLGLWSVVTHRFYQGDRREVRFGLGLAPTAVPLEEAAWINAHQPVGRLWTDVDMSSNMHYFTRPRRDVPLLTNTWAAPPEVMGRVLDYMAGRRPFAEMTDRYGVEVVALFMDGSSVALARALAADPNWAVVHVGAPFVVFLHATGRNAELARRTALTGETLDTKALADRLRRLDPVPSFPLYLAGFTLSHLGWDTPAIAMFDEALKADPHYFHRHFVLSMKGVSLARRGTRRMLRHPPDLMGREDWHEARRCFIEALRARPDYEKARRNLRLVERQIEAERHGVILDPLMATWGLSMSRTRQ